MDAGGVDVVPGGADDQVAAALAEPRGDRGGRGPGHDPGLGQPPEQVAAQWPLRHGLLPGADREVDLVGAGDLERDLQPGVPGPDHQDLPRVRAREVAGVSVGRAVQLGHRGGEPAADAGDGGLLERPGGHDDLPGPQGALAGGDPEQAASRCVDGARTRVLGMTGRSNRAA